MCSHHRQTIVVSFYTGTAHIVMFKYTSVKFRTTSKSHTQLSRCYHLHSLAVYSTMHSASIRDASECAYVILHVGTCTPTFPLRHM